LIASFSFETQSPDQSLDSTSKEEEEEEIFSFNNADYEHKAKLAKALEKFKSRNSGTALASETWGQHAKYTLPPSKSLSRRHSVHNPSVFCFSRFSETW
jgi:hypothetical protein